MKSLTLTFLTVAFLLGLRGPAHACGSGPKPVHYGPRVTTAPAAPAPTPKPNPSPVPAPQK